MTETSSPQRKRPHVNLVFIGHKGHGKSTLVAALAKQAPRLSPVETGTLPARLVIHWLKEFESAPTQPNTNDQRKSTRSPQYAWVDTTKRRYGLIDTPGGRRLVKPTAVACAQADGYVLVVSALDSVMAQTREHVVLAKEQHGSLAAVYINHCDQVDDPGMIDLVEAETREAIQAYGVNGDEVPVVRGSASRALSEDPAWIPSIKALLDAVDESFVQPARLLEQPLVFPIESVFKPHSRLAQANPNSHIVAGRVERGILETHATVEIIGLSQEVSKATIESIEVYKQPVSRAVAGEIAGVCLKKLNEPPLRGQCIVSSKTRTPALGFECNLSLLAGTLGGRTTACFTGHQANFILSTATITGYLDFGESVPLAMPGSHYTNVVVHLVKPAVIDVGQHFAFRDGCDGFQVLRKVGPQWSGTAGSGVITRVLGS